MPKPSQPATTNNSIHTFNTQTFPEVLSPSSVLQCHSRHLPNHAIFRSHNRISTAFIGQVSLPYTSTLCTHALYIFPFTFNEAPLAVNNPLKSLNFPQAHLTLALDASSAPPPFPITSPK